MTFKPIKHTTPIKPYQPWYDDERDYNTNAPTYYDYLSKFNGVQKGIIELLNKVARQDIQVEDTNSIQLTKTGDWQNDDDDTALSADIKVSSLAQNDLVVKPDGVYAHTDLSQVEQAINELQAKAIMNTWYTDDFNTLTQHGLYKQKYQPKNAPKHLSQRYARLHENVWFAIVLSNNNTGENLVCTQIAVSAGTTVDMYMRHSEQGVWSDWLLISGGLETDWPTDSVDTLTVHGIYKPKYQPTELPSHYENSGKHDEIWSVISLSNNKEQINDLVNTQIAVSNGGTQDIWTRYIYEGNWSDWRKIAMDVESDWYTNDFNELKVNGLYKPKYKPLNAPTSKEDEGEHPNIWTAIVMSNNKSGNDLVCTQLAITGGEDKAIYFRYVFNSEWREWKKVTTDYDFETKEQVIESTLNTLNITHGTTGTNETSKVDVNPQKVLLHDNLLVGASITKVHDPESNTTTIGVSASYTKRIEDLEKALSTANQTITTLQSDLTTLTARVETLEHPTE